MISMLLYLFTFLSIAWAQYGQFGNMATDQLIESQKGLDSLIKKNMRNLVRQNFGYWIEDQKKSASRFGLSCEAEWDLLCTNETVADCSCLRYFEGELVRYSTADLVCTSNGGNLPVIHSELKNKFLFVYPDNFKMGAWIGLKNNNGEFIWVDGSYLSVTYWNPGAPTSEGDCVHYVGDEEALNYVALDFKWKDSSCTEERPVVCEKKPTSTTTTITNSQSEITTTNSQSEMTTTNSQSELTTAESQLVPTTTEKPDDCPEGYEKKCFNSSCYCYGVKNANYWGNAVSVCRSEGADMVSIHSQTENDYIRDLTKANNWIGCLRGSDKWGDGTLINYTNWRTTYDDHTLGYMNVAAYNGQWLGLSYFDIQLPFVCKN